MIRNKLARYAHSAWSGWMKYMFSKSHYQNDGSLVIPPDLVKRWYRQMHTAYSELPAQEQNSDLDEADRIMKIVTEDWFTENESD